MSRLRFDSIAFGLFRFIPGPFPIGDLIQQHHTENNDPNYDKNTEQALPHVLQGIQKPIHAEIFKEIHVLLSFH